MAKRRRTVPHLWNRFMAAVLFVLGAALSPTAPVETKETRVAKAEATQLEAAGAIELGGQLSADLAAKLDGTGNGGNEDQPALAPAVFALSDRAVPRASVTPGRRAAPADRPARDGDSRAPPSA